MELELKRLRGQGGESKSERKAAKLVQGLRRQLSLAKESQELTETNLAKVLNVAFEEGGEEFRTKGPSNYAHGKQEQTHV